MSGTRLLGWGAALCLMISAGISEAQKLPDDIAASKVIKVAVNSGYPPMEMKDEKTGELTGFDIDLMAAMAKVLGLKVEYQDGAFEAMTPALQSERVNMIMSGFYDVPKRRPMFTFIDYLRAGAQFYTLVSLPEIKELTDLCGKTITTSRGTSYPDTVKTWSDKNCVGAGKPAIDVIIDTDLGQQLTNLKTGRAVAAVQGTRSRSDDCRHGRDPVPPFGQTLLVDTDGHGVSAGRNDASGRFRLRSEESHRGRYV